MDSLNPPDDDWTSRHEAELRALACRAGPRVEAVPVGGRKVWVKRLGFKEPPFLQRLHLVLSPILPAHLHASPVLDALGAAERELRKTVRFQAAGFPTPAVLWHEHGVIELADVGPSLQSRLSKLRKTDAGAHAALIVDIAAALGSLHASGLCHGRPHPRDMFRQEDGRIGFFDFEEEPEAVMPLPAAQARDLWVFFINVSKLGARPGTLEAAWAAYWAAAPAAVQPQFGRLLRLARPFVAVASVLPAFLVHQDLERMIAAVGFLTAPH